MPVAGAIGYWSTRQEALEHFRKISHLGPATKSAKRTEHCRRMGIKGRAVLARMRAEAKQEAFIESLGLEKPLPDRPPVPEDGDFLTVEERIWRTMQAVGPSSEPGVFTMFP